MSGNTNNEMLNKLITSADIEIVLRENGRWLGIANVILAEKLEIRGWRIGKSNFEENPYWIQPPSYGHSKSGKPYYSWWLNDKELASILEIKITEAFDDKRIDEEEIPY